MKDNKALFFILAMTVVPFLLAGLLASSNITSNLSKKHHGQFFQEDQYLNLPFNHKTWHIIADENNPVILEKLEKIKIALGKRSARVDIITTTELDSAAYIAAPNGQLLLYYQASDIGKPFLQDLLHLLRSNNQ